MGSFKQVTVSLVLIVNIGLVLGISVEQDLSLTLSQKNALDKFREIVQPLLEEPWQKTDVYLIRWLRARDFNLKSAEEMLRANLRWRKENRMNEILQEDWSEIMKAFPATLDSEDKEGRPVGTIDIWEWDIRRGALQGKGQIMLRYMNYLMENATIQVFQRQQKGMNVTQWTTLGNADGFNIIQHGCGLCIPLWIQFIQSLENNYPGWYEIISSVKLSEIKLNKYQIRLNEYILIDAPSTISVILEAIKPFLSQQTRDAFRIFGPNRSKWLPYLDERIEKSERRPQYGGTKPPLRL